jgi:hypothetical protein
MENLTVAQIKTLSDDTFFDNDQGAITSAAHRAFNNALIDFATEYAAPRALLAATFIVDSDAALAAWANNTPGNDYTSVLIMPGTWTSSKQVNLTMSGTKTVTGMSGSLLLFTSTNYGLTYGTIPTSPEYWMKNVNMLIDVNSSLSGLYNCTNLMDCTITSSGSAFRNCKNLINCNGIGVGIGTAFYGCTYLMNCTGAAGGNSSAFYNCRIMSFCKPGPTQSTSNIYNGCYMHAAGTDDPVSDTAAGGWNRTS